MAEIRTTKPNIFKFVEQVDVSDLKFYNCSFHGSVIIETIGDAHPRTIFGQHGTHDYELDYGFIIQKDETKTQQNKTMKAHTYNFKSTYLAEAFKQELHEMGYGHAVYGDKYSPDLPYLVTYYNGGTPVVHYDDTPDSSEDPETLFLLEYDWSAALLQARAEMDKIKKELLFFDIPVQVSDDGGEEKYITFGYCLGQERIALSTLESTFKRLNKLETSLGGATPLGHITNELDALLFNIERK